MNPSVQRKKQGKEWGPLVTMSKKAFLALHK